ncbi:MAG: peptidoglycan DD-metalloendopeptidase family protein [bacterium]
MKPLHDYKKPYKRLAALVMLSAVFVPILFVRAQTAQDIQAKIEQRNADIAALEKEISQYQGQLNTLGQQKSSLNNSLAELDLNRKKLNADISVTGKKIENTNATISTLGTQIVSKEDAIENDKEAIKLGFRSLDELETTNAAATILSRANFSDVWNDIDNIITVRDNVRDKIVELQHIKGDLEVTRTDTTNARDELVKLKAQLADQKKIVDQNTAEKNKLLAQTKDNEANYQKLLQDRVAKKTTFEKEISDYESQLKYILDPSKLPGGGVLSWPLDNIYVTQLFGKTEAGKRLYATGSHNGVDFRASVGTPVKAMADGVVAGTGDTDVQCPGVSFGRFVLIKYDNGLASTFGHFSLIKVAKGDRVVRGQVVGYSGATGYVTGPHLHVSIYARDAVDLQTLPSKSCPGHVLTQPISPTNAYLDPMIYLPPYKAP